MKGNKGTLTQNGPPERTGTRDVVETAIDLSKGNKTESWEKMARSMRAKRWAAEKERKLTKSA